MSEFRRKLMLNQEESDIEYVKRQFNTLRIPYPCSFLGSGEGDRLLLRDYRTSSDEPTPLVRITLLADSTVTKKPSTWWGAGDGNSLRLDSGNYSLFHIPASVNKVTLTFSNTDYQIAGSIFTNQTQPRRTVDTSWRSASSPIVLDMSSMNYDVWIAYTIKCVANGKTPKIYSSYQIIYNNEESFKNSLGLQVTVE